MQTKEATTFKYRGRRFERTGETRQVEPNEFYFSDGCVEHWTRRNESTAGEYAILREIPDPNKKTGVTRIPEVHAAHLAAGHVKEAEGVANVPVQIIPLPETPADSRELLARQKINTQVAKVEAASGMSQVHLNFEAQGMLTLAEVLGLFSIEEMAGYYRQLNTALQA